MSNAGRRSVRPRRILALVGIMAAVLAGAIATRAGGSPKDAARAIAASKAPAMTLAAPSASTVARSPVARIGQAWTWPLPTVDYAEYPDVEAGLLDPGVYEVWNVDQQKFNARFTVPAGWTWNGRYLSKGAIDAPGGAAIWLFGGPVHVYQDPCHWIETGPSSATTTAQFSYQIIDALAAQPKRDATLPVELAPTGRYRAHAIVLTVPDIDFATCDAGEYRSWGPDANARRNERAGQIDVVWSVDVDGARIESGPPPPPGGLMVDAAFFDLTPTAVIAEMQAILASLRVGLWG